MSQDSVGATENWASRASSCSLRACTFLWALPCLSHHLEGYFSAWSLNPKVGAVQPGVAIQNQDLILKESNLLTLVPSLKTRKEDKKTWRKATTICCDCGKWLVIGRLAGMVQGHG